MRRSGRACLLVVLAGCATFSPNLSGIYVAPEATVRPASSAPPALVLIGDIGLGRGPDTVRLARAVARRLESAPGAPVLVLGDVFYPRGLVSTCGPREVTARSCDASSSLEAQLESVLGPYRDALRSNPLIGIGGNHDFYGGREALDNACKLLPRGGAGWRYVARGCGLDASHPVERLDLGELTILLLDSEPMLRERGWRKQSLAALHGELERLRRERPGSAVLVAAHHPLETHGAHNGAGLGGAVRKDFYLVSSTALLPLAWPLRRFVGQQEPYQRHYRSYRRDLYRLFRELPIHAFVSGHDHSLQHVVIDHPGVQHQIVSGAGTHRSRVKRRGLDLFLSGRLARAVGLRDAWPAPRHELRFGLGGPQSAPDLSGWGFATLTPTEGGLQVEFFDPARDVPVYSALLADRGDSCRPGIRPGPNGTTADLYSRP